MTSEAFLHRYFLNHSGQVIHKWFHYFDVYERHFERFRGTAVNFLEIGVDQGGSQQMWRAYFGPAANILCIDVRDLSHRVQPEVAKFYQGDQTDRKLLERIVDENGPLDIVLDDGSHVSKDIIASFEVLYPLMSSTGVYMVEDVSCVYKKRYNGGFRQPGSFIEYTKELVDHMNFAHIKQIPNSDSFGNSTFSISIYDAIVVFERRPKSHPQWARTGKLGSLGSLPFTPDWPQRTGSPSPAAAGPRAYEPPPGNERPSAKRRRLRRRLRRRRS